MAEGLSTKKLTRKERELEFRVNIVLDAAEEVFSEKVFAQVSVEEIASRAEISVGTLYNLFRSKEDVYSGVVSRAQRVFFDSLDERAGNARGPRDQIQAVVKGFFEHFKEHDRAFRLYVSASNGFQWELKSKLAEEAHEQQQAFMGTLVNICQAGMDKGVFKKGVPADMLAVTIMGIPHSYLLYWLEREENFDLLGVVPAAAATVDRILGTD